jgi:hypothetical protein
MVTTNKQGRQSMTRIATYFAALCRASLCGASISASAFAQEQTPPSPAPATPSGERRFTIKDFEQFSPVNALDMVQRIPGFSIEGDQGQRGFGGNVGNVLIDGDRPSTKSEDIFTLLSRIPATQVEHIILSESAGADGEARGKANVVNVIRKTSKAVSGTYDVTIGVGQRHDVTPFGSASASVKRGATTFEINGGVFDEDLRALGGENFLDGNRRFIERRYYRGHGGYSEASVGGAIKSRVGSTKINANGKVEWGRGFDDRFGDITGPNGAVIGLETLISRGPQWDMSFELGGDVEFPLAKSLSTKLIGLWGDVSEESRTTINTDFAALPDTGFIANSNAGVNEGIFRVQNDWSGVKAHAIQFGVEVAYNRLTSRFSQASIFNQLVTPLPSSFVRVSELRFEPFLSDVWTISPAWKLEAGLVFETSKLRVSGGSSARRSLQFVKPRAVASLTISKKTSMEFRAERDVAQLDFNEFATSVDVGAGNQVDAGNSELVPEQTTSLSALIRHKFLERGSIQLKAEYQRVNDTQDLIPIIIRDNLGNITAQFDGAGNIGKSTRNNVELEITLPFDWATKSIGISGMELKYVGHYHGSRVNDPVTGQARRMSNRPLWHQNWEFRHDIGKTGIAWGFQAFAAAAPNQSFFNQFRTTYQDPQITGFIEFKKFKYGTLKFQVVDATSALWERNRYFYQGSRASNTIVGFIERDRRFDRRFQLSLSGKF